MRNWIIGIVAFAVGIGAMWLGTNYTVTPKKPSTIENVQMYADTNRNAILKLAGHINTLYRQDSALNVRQDSLAKMINDPRRTN